jgi:hypothetical protein
MVSKFLIGLAVSFACIGSFTSTNAETITNPNELTPGYSLIDFESETGFSNPYTVNGVTFTSVTGSLIRFNISHWPANGTEIQSYALFPGAEPDSAILITFQMPVAEFLLGWGDPNFEGNTLIAYDANGTILEQAAVALGPPGGGHAAWVGFKRSQADIFSVLVQPDQSLSSGDDYVIDNVHYRTSTSPPNCSTAQAYPSVLWAPNSQFVPVVVMGVTDPDGDSVTITVTAVTQDEPVIGPSSGNTNPDAIIVAGGGTVRAERNGNGNGRVYQLQFKAEDGHGGSCTGAVKMHVPHSMLVGITAVDDGQSYDSTVP